MLKKRIIPIQLLLDDRLVKTVSFGEYRDVGDPVKSAAVYNSQYADELMFLNIDRQGRSIEPMAKLIERVAEVSFMPLAVGGGIRTDEDAAFLIRHGADKVVINSAAYGDATPIRRTAETFGSQAVIVGIDARFDDDAGGYVLYSHNGTRRQDVSLPDHIARCIEQGAGEIMIQSMDRDGTMSGFDIPLIRQVMAASDVPVIACGGSGNYEHLKEAFLETDVSALGCGSLFNFSDSNPIRAMNFLSNYGLAFKRV